MDASPNEPEIEIIPGREAPPHTPVQDWVSLADIPPAWLALYVKMRMHVNRERGDAVIWPGTDSLAKMMGAGRGDKISPMLRGLAKLGAIDIVVSKNSWPRRHIYVVHSMPPPNYAGPLTLKQWYDRNRAELDAARADAKAKRDARKARKDQVSPVTPISGQQGAEPPVAPESGVPVAPKSGDTVAPESGREPYEVNPHEVNPPPNPQTDPPAGNPAEDRTVGGEDLFEKNTDEQLLAAVDEVRRLKPGWSKRGILTSMRYVIKEDDRSVAATIAAMLVVAADPVSTTPGRIKVDGPWWAATVPTATFGAPEVQRCPQFGHGPIRDGRCGHCDREEKLRREIAEENAKAGDLPEDWPFIPPHLRQKVSQ